METSDTVCYVDEGYLVMEQSSNRDDVRRETFRESSVDYTVDQGAGSIRLITPELGQPGQLIIYTSRPYPQFDPTRLAAGTADSDTNDAPLITVATGGIAKMYENLSEQEGPDQVRYYRLSEKWRKKFELLALSQQYTHTGDQRSFGLPLPTATNWGRSASRR